MKIELEGLIVPELDAPDALTGERDSQARLGRFAAATVGVAVGALVVWSATFGGAFGPTYKVALEDPQMIKQITIMADWPDFHRSIAESLGGRPSIEGVTPGADQECMPEYAPDQGGMGTARQTC